MKRLYPKRYYTNPHFRTFLGHRANALYQGRGFELTFEQWLSIWKKSGHLHERGRGRGKYVMARFGDRGPYAVGKSKSLARSWVQRKRDYGPTGSRPRKAPRVPPKSGPYPRFQGGPPMHTAPGPQKPPMSGYVGSGGGSR